MKILISGGHLTPALALVDYVKKNHPHDELIFVGRIFSQTKLRQLAQEKKEVAQRGIKFVPLKAVRISKTRPFFAQLTAPIVFLKSVIMAWLIFINEKPTIFVSFGGYVALPLAVAAFLTKTPIITHEQTHAAGIANQIIAKLAQKVAISHSSSAKYFPSKKIVLTGNLIRPELITKTTKRPEWIHQPFSKPVLLVMGGNQGSWIINQTVMQALPILTKDWTVIHLCGQSHSQIDYEQKLKLATKNLPATQQKNYYVREWASSQDMAWIYNNSQAAVSRAGANTVMELTLKSIPTVFIPLPFSRHNEQQINAQFLVKQKAAELISQKQLTPNLLVQKLELVKSQKLKFTHRLNQIQIPTNAAELFYQLMVEASSHEA
ncbi:UDP-N-acetylglucosamine--N-acetylmuramyl-(pentapeptide) pyrophosphoryl-undecaprenol N-acetylglucosamine transferase [Patescibacteria group bacterium]|nr:UDP-N-acetylglucosamine--N-acetylmuramyl-(pentapeptide) pyrophosphoryl-undecaprenol N-acetylglucosamine transferase [Patescibacteria group bacterium]MBU1966908.1 UDP-N-acetylglucosamine--N-acetylmuramyl-(pentapeptide) pyrophosphoryl-undecaprenol N-acetylglucosamine transferase [Patescibacteria group bacterium]